MVQARESWKASAGALRRSGFSQSARARPEAFSLRKAAAAFSLICAARLVFLLCDDAAVAFNEESVAENSFGVVTGFVALTGWFCG